MREFALKELNIRSKVDGYFAIYNENKDKQDKNDKLIACFNELYSDMKNMKSRINAFESSTSWRITAPLRYAMDNIRRALNGIK